MVEEGKRIYLARLSGTKKDIYGKTPPSPVYGNHIVVTNQAGFLEMEAWVEQNGKKGAGKNDNHIPVQIGAIVIGKGEMALAGINPGGGHIHVQIEMPNSTTKHVMHLSSGEGATLTGEQAQERSNILTENLGGKNPSIGHFKTLNEIIRHIDGFETGL
jgi:hypothetical protein